MTLSARLSRFRAWLSCLVVVAILPIERFAEAAAGAAAAGIKTLPAGHPGFERLSEAVTTEFGALLELVRQALRDKVRLEPGLGDYYVDIQGLFPERVVARMGGRLWAWPYTLTAENTVALGERAEVVVSFAPVREAAAGGALPLFREAADGSGAIEVTLIRSGLSLNNAFYSDAALQGAVKLFEGVRVFAKSDAQHLKGEGKDVRDLLGGVYGVRFVAGATPDSGALVGTFRPIDPEDAVVRKMVEACKRGLQGLMGLSIDASAKTRREQRGGKTVRVAEKFVKVDSVDLIVEPGAGGGLDRLAEAADPSADQDPNRNSAGASMFKTRLLAALAALNAARAAGMDAAKVSDDDVATALREACTAAKLDYGQVVAQAVAAASDAGVAGAVQRLVEAAAGTQQREANAGGGGEGDDAPVTRAELAMLRLREAATRTVLGTNLPQFTKDRLLAQLDARERFTEADVAKLIADERKYVARFSESGRVAIGSGDDLQVQDRGLVVKDMLDAFFDPAHKDHRKVHSFRECYIEITGDRRVTGRLSDCDVPRLREALGSIADEHLREAISSSTFANVLGDSITRRMMAVYGQLTELDAWRQVAQVTSVNDFRTQERVQMGGYGNLPAVAQSAAYAALTSPGDLKATYAATKRGGLETITLETIKNDDVGAVRRVPQELALAAKNTLHEFVFDFFRTNPTVYDTLALYHATHGNLFTAALSAAEFATHRLAMAKLTRLSSAKRRGVTPKRLLVPFDLQETAYNLFVRNQNLDKTFVQTVNPMVIPIAYWTDANDWVSVADPMDLPCLEIGFLDGREEPELFVQDMPNVGSLFSNDQITYKIRHIYGGAVVPEGEKATTKAVVP